MKMYSLCRDLLDKTQPKTYTTHKMVKLSSDTQTPFGLNICLCRDLLDETQKKRDSRLFNYRHDSGIPYSVLMHPTKCNTINIKVRLLSDYKRFIIITILICDVERKNCYFLQNQL